MKALRYFRKKSQQKVGMPLLLGIAILILVPFIVWLLALQQKTYPAPLRQQETLRKLETTPSDSMVTAEPTHSLPSKKQEVKELGDFVYTEEKYSIDYPRNWKIKEEKLEDGRSIIIKPSYLADDVFVPSLSVTVSQDIAHPYLTERKALYTSIAFAFKKDGTYLDHMFAQRLKGKSPVSDKENIVQEVHTFLNKDGYSYAIVYKYTNPVVSKESEKTFSDIIATFKFR